MIRRLHRRRGIQTLHKHVPNLVCMQQFCARCEDVDDDRFERRGNRKHFFWNDPVGDLLNYLCEPRLWANKIVAIAHNAKACDLHFILNRAIMLKWKPELTMNGLKIISMKLEHLVLLDSCPFSHVLCLYFPRLLVWKPANHGTPTTSILRVNSIM
jgi:hypothetical protein